MIVLTLNEIKNGWTEAALKKYRKEIERETHDVLYGQRQPKKQDVQNSQYNPNKWRK